jgi:ankyrin repeat protein
LLKSSTDLVIASCKNHVDVALSLIDHGVNIAHQETVLLHAATLNNSEMFSMLLDHVANIIDHRDNNGQTALIWLCQ